MLYESFPAETRLTVYRRAPVVRACCGDGCAAACADKLSAHVAVPVVPPSALTRLCAHVAVTVVPPPALTGGARMLR